jgi:DNA polymerase-1
MDLGWLRHDSRRLQLDTDTFEEMAEIHPEIRDLRKLRQALSELRLNDLAVGDDGYNRCLLSPFSSRTSRNQPSNSKYIFGPGSWLRGLIKPQEGWGVSYIDFEQQEFAIAAALSGDPSGCTRMCTASSGNGRIIRSTTLFSPVDRAQYSVELIM